MKFFGYVTGQIFQIHLIHDAFELKAWKDFMREDKYKNVVLDTHQYLMMAEAMGCPQTVEGYKEFITLSVQGTKRLCHVILSIFGVILSRRTSSTPLSSALKMGKIPMAEVGESEGAKFAVLQDT